MKVRYIEDYYPKIKEKYPDLEDWEIDKILKHGMQSFFTLNSRGADVIIKSAHRGFVAYFGKLFKNALLWTRYSILKYQIKYRLKYILKNKGWNGYYYFGLTEEDYKKYIPIKKGRIKKKITFKDFKAYKIEEEPLLQKRYIYFFKVKMENEGGFIINLDSFSTRNIEMYAKRNKDGKIIYM